MNAPPAPPFAPDDRIVEFRYPESGMLIVASCQLRYGRWRITARRNLSTLSASADGFRRAPADWVDPPPHPVSAVSALECSTDGPISPEQRAQARREDDARLAERIDYALGMADWWVHVGSTVNPDLAERSARSWRLIAAEIQLLAAGWC